MSLAAQFGFDAHLTPAQHDHINFYGTYSFDVETELRRQGHRPLLVTGCLKGPDSFRCKGTRRARLPCEATDCR